LRRIGWTLVYRPGYRSIRIDVVSLVTCVGIRYLLVNVRMNVTHTLKQFRTFIGTDLSDRGFSPLNINIVSDTDLLLTSLRRTPRSPSQFRGKAGRKARRILLNEEPLGRREACCRGAN